MLTYKIQKEMNELDYTLNEQEGRLRRKHDAESQALKQRNEQ